ncbi:1673_t:CDS:2 [Dentiscutata erythropus]|uniref:1673_t:CDS:1 n=1 Tax=Dentiscutata erythropus TaxID=1348616 RepID=A0A9N9GA60_9GLOM|nr:1673_t:CDS:2 [Dentiscutata erythropus]
MRRNKKRNKPNEPQEELADDALEILALLSICSLSSCTSHSLPLQTPQLQFNNSPKSQIAHLTQLQLKAQQSFNSEQSNIFKPHSQTRSLSQSFGECSDLSKSPHESTKRSSGNIDNITKVSSLANEDRLMLQKTMQYAITSLELAYENKNAMSRVEELVQNLVQIIIGTNDDNDVMTTPGVYTKQRRIRKWFLKDVADAIFELLENDKNADDLVMKNMYYDKLKNNFHKKMIQIKNSQGG